MKLKEFLRFKWVKLIIFIIFAIISYKLILLNQCFGPGPNAPPLSCLNNIVLKLLYIFLIPFILLFDIINGKELIYYFTTILFFILQVIYIYILSCFIYFITKKFNKNKK